MIILLFSLPWLPWPSTYENQSWAVGGPCHNRYSLKKWTRSVKASRRSSVTHIRTHRDPSDNNIIDIRITYHAPSYSPHQSKFWWGKSSNYVYFVSTRSVPHKEPPKKISRNFPCRLDFVGPPKIDIEMLINVERIYFQLTFDYIFNKTGCLNNFLKRKLDFVPGIRF